MERPDPRPDHRRVREPAGGSVRNGRGAGIVARGRNVRHWKPFVLALAVAASMAAVSRASDEHVCFSSDNERRIAGCTELIEQPGVPANTRAAAHATRALAYSQKGQYERAVRDFDAAIQLVPDFAVALNNRAWVHFKSGRPAVGLPDVEESLRIEPTSHHAYDTRAHIRQW